MKRIDLLKIIANGGATLDASGAAVSFRRGYQVSRKDSENDKQPARGYTFRAVYRSDDGGIATRRNCPPNMADSHRKQRRQKK